jgi:hypothetical protein
MSQVIIGADPEIFIEDSKGNLIPAFEFLPSKDKPLKTNSNQTCYWDGFQAEFTVQPSNDLNECIKSMQGSLQTILKQARYLDPKARISKQNVVPVSLDYLKTLEHHLVEFGCMPSYNIYNIAGMGTDGLVTPYRFAGGHIHFGIGQHPPEVIERIVKSLDNVLGLACVILFKEVDNPIRRQYYGLVGEYRLPPHGLEYRTLSNAWLQDPKLTYQILDLAQKIVEHTLTSPLAFKATQEQVVETILTCNVDKARKIIQDNLDVFKLLNYDISLLPIVVDKDVHVNWNL